MELVSGGSVTELVRARLLTRLPRASSSVSSPSRAWKGLGQRVARDQEMEGKRFRWTNAIDVRCSAERGIPSLVTRREKLVSAKAQNPVFACPFVAAAAARARFRRTAWRPRARPPYQPTKTSRCYAASGASVASTVCGAMDPSSQSRKPWTRPRHASNQSRKLPP